jgi:hypothetical protein
MRTEGDHRCCTGAHVRPLHRSVGLRSLGISFDDIGEPQTSWTPKRGLAVEFLIRMPFTKTIEGISGQKRRNDAIVEIVHGTEGIVVGS